MADLMTREEFQEKIVGLCDRTARKYNQPPLSEEEAEDLYRQYVRGNGSLFAVVDERP